MLERLFDLTRHRTSVATELRAGTVTFLTMAYILFLNPQILSAAGLPAADVLLATALASALACLVMGLWAKLPFALAPGMGLNAYFAYTVVGSMGVDWRVALAAVFVEGLIFLVLSVSGARTALLAAIPRSLKLATMSGIGLFLALIGLSNAGLVRADEATLVALGDLRQPATLLALAGILAAAALMARRIKGALLIVICGLSAVAWTSGLAPAPERLWSLPALPRETLFALDLPGLLTPAMVGVVFAFLFVDLLDTAGTLIGVGQLAGFVDERGEMEASDRAFAADAVGTSAGALLGTSTVTTYIESATGVEEGGRTGLTAVVVAALFLASLFFAPVFVAVPSLATAPALVVVGTLMMRGARDVEWRRMEDALPAFLTVAVMPFTFSIAHGIAAGLVAHVGIRLLVGRWREVSWGLAVVTALIVAYYAFSG